jgi:hypothetical protein
MKRIVCTALAVAMLAAVSVAVLAADEKAPAATDPMALAMPGPHHEHIKKLVGDYDYTIKMYMVPGQPPMESTGKRSGKMIMGDRYLEETYSGSFMGMDFEGYGTLGYDNVQQTYLSTWIDNMGTGIMFASGTCDASGTSWTMTGDMADPQSGQMVPTRGVTKLVDKDHMTMEMYAPGPDGKEVKVMEIIATRSK